MSKRFINCSACKGCHTGRGGQFCPFILKTSLQDEHAGDKMASVGEPEMPDKDSAEYEPYLTRKIREEEERLEYLQHRSHIVELETQLSQLRLKSASLDHSSAGDSGAEAGRGPGIETGVASAVLTASQPGAAGHLLAGSPGTFDVPSSSHQPYRQRSKEEKEILSKLRALSHLPEGKPVEKVTYREFISSMTKVAQVVCDLGIDPLNYISHMNFISTKAALNLYATDAMIKYEAAVTERVISGQYKDWTSADPECVALHLGADATYAVRQGGGRWNRQGSSFSGSNRDFSEWPKEVCWLFNNTLCYFPRCKKAHICAKCKKTGHPMKECKSSDDSGPPSQPETLSGKQQKEARKP